MEILTMKQFAQRFGTTSQCISEKIRTKRAERKGTILQQGKEYVFKRVSERCVLFYVDDSPVVESRKLYQRKHSVE